MDLRGPKVCLLMENTLGMKQRCPNERSVTFRLRKKDGTYLTPPLPSYTVPQICSKIDPILINPDELDHLRDVRLADTLPHDKPKEIEVLLGDPYCTHILTGVIIRPKNDDVHSIKAIGSQLGFYLAGKQPLRGKSKSPKIKYTVLQTKVTHVEDIQAFWKHEDLGIEPPNDEEETLDEKLAVEKMEKTAVYCPEKKYWTVSLLWIDEKFPVTGVQEAKAVARRMEKILEKDPNMASQMNAAFKELEEAGFTEENPPESEFEKEGYFVQIHGVFRDSLTTRLRLVTNCAAIHKPMLKSINDYLVRGPLYLKELTHLLLKWRVPKFAWTADLSKFYLRLRLDSNSKLYHKFFWRNCDTTKPFKIYNWTRTVFGMKESPFKAMYVLKKTAEMFKHEYPAANDVLQNDVYLDDVVSNSDTEEETIKVINDVVTVLAKANLPLHKVITSSEKVNAALPADIKAIDTKTRVLGLGWDAAKDTMSVNVNLDGIGKAVLTKRGLLQQLARCFEPLGHYSPFYMQAKLLMAKTFQTEPPLLWDDPLPDDIRKPFIKWLEELKELKNCELPRRCVDPGFEPSHLAVFSDASSVGLGSAAYLCSRNDKGEIRSHLVFAKSRIVDRSQKWTIPRLELAAAVLGVKVGQHVKKALNIEKCYYFSDSDCCLYWQRLSPLSQKVWVGNRLTTLRKWSSPDDFYYCPTSLNVGDIGSRGCSLAELLANKAWWEGPQLLRSDHTTWQRTSQTKSEAQIKAEIADEQKPEPKPKVLRTNVVKDVIFDNFIKRNSDYPKTVRQVCYINRFLSWLFRKNENHPHKWNFKDKFITVKEFRQGEDLLFRRTQQICFKDEWKILQKNVADDDDHQVAKSSPLFKLNPFFNVRRQLIMVKSRLSDNNLFQDLVLLPYKTEEEEDGLVKLRRQKNKVILKNHPLTTQLVRFTHLTNIHAPMATTHSILRHRVWILGGRKAISSFLFGCLCRKPVPITQQIGQLPPTRTDAFHSFVHQACDFFGPLMYKQSNDDPTPHKCWGLVFCCFNTRAIKLFLVKDLTTETFLDCLTKLECFVGRSSLIQCDNQTTFKSASKELKALLKRINWDHLQKTGTPKGTTFVFTSEYCPSENGLIESLVKNCKRNIRPAIGSRLLTFEKLDVVFAEVEAIVNQRPIAYYESDNLDDCRAITPFELLNGRPRDPLPDPKSYKGLSLAEVWAIRKRILIDFWKLWSRQYLTDLQLSKKWPKKNQVPIQEGLRCLVKDKNMSRNNWKSAIIVDLHPSPSDGLIRKVTLRTPKGSLIRRNVRELSYYEDSLITRP